MHVADAMLYPDQTYRVRPIPDHYAKAYVNRVELGHEVEKLDYPTADGITQLGEAVDKFVLWHKADIKFQSTPRVARPPARSPPPLAPSPPLAAPTEGQMIEAANADMSLGNAGTFCDNEAMGGSPNQEAEAPPHQNLLQPRIQ